MALFDVKSMEGETVSQLELSDLIYNQEIKPHVLHEFVKMQLASRRAGTRAVKNRTNVAGSRKKLYRQKGTGRARAGDIKSPLRRGGGVIFGPQPKSFAYKLSKKFKKLALKMALSSKFKDDKILIFDKIDFNEPKTKDFLAFAKKFNIEKSSLIITAQDLLNLELSSRNVPYVKVLNKNGLNVYDILKYDNLIFIEPVVQAIEERLL